MQRLTVASLFVALTLLSGPAGAAVAYDSTTPTLHRVRGSKGTTIARDVASGSFALTGDGVALWQDNSLRLIR